MRRCSSREISHPNRVIKPVEKSVDLPLPGVPALPHPFLMHRFEELIRVRAMDERCKIVREQCGKGAHRLASGL